MSEIATKSWFDGRVTLALVFAMLVQAFGALLWVGGAAQRLDSIESRLANQSNVSERLARLEAEMAAARMSLGRIETRLDRGARP
jgi:nicotinamide riboside transporter PnuC